MSHDLGIHNTLLLPCGRRWLLQRRGRVFACDSSDIGSIPGWNKYFRSTTHPHTHTYDHTHARRKTVTFGRQAGRKRGLADPCVVEITAFFVFTGRDKCHVQKADRSFSICPQIPILFGSIVRPFLAVSLVGLQCVIVVFLDHTHLLYNIPRIMAKISEIEHLVGNLDSS